MTTVNLSTHDINVLEKIKDPESDPLQRIRVDPSIPRDPHVSDPEAYKNLVDQERGIIKRLQEADVALGGTRSEDLRAVVIERYERAVAQLCEMVSRCPDYASAMNNRAQVARRLYGDGMLVRGPPDPLALVTSPSPAVRHEGASMALHDLNKCIALLTPPSPASPISPQAARTLAAAHTQRAAIYHRTAKILAQGHHLDVDEQALHYLAGWKRLEFEEAASRDFAWGGRYGNEIAKALAVGTNPTAKLCGEIVRGAMKKEYGEAFAG